MKKRRTRWEEGSTPMQVVKGAYECVNSAENLFGAAEQLKEGGFYSIPGFLYCTAIEETGKAFCVLEFANTKQGDTDKAARELYQQFYSHEDKLKAGLLKLAVVENGLEHIVKCKASGSADWFVNAMRAARSSIGMPDVSLEVQHLFNTRNSMLYTESNGKTFVNPHVSKTEDSLIELRELADKLIAHAKMDTVWTEFLLCRGLTMDDAARIFMDNLPEIFRELRNKLARISSAKQ